MPEKRGESKETQRHHTQMPPSRFYMNYLPRKWGDVTKKGGTEGKKRNKDKPRDLASVNDTGKKKSNSYQRETLVPIHGDFIPQVFKKQKGKSWWALHKLV